MVAYANSFNLFLDDEKKHLIIMLGQNVPSIDGDTISEEVEYISKTILDTNTASELAKSIEELLKR